jgi:hypothetical protein
MAASRWPVISEVLPLTDAAKAAEPAETHQ